MSRDVSYYEDAITYNEGLANAAAELAEDVRNDEIKRWCLSVSKQHQIHAGRHRRALNRLIRRSKSEATEAKETPVESAKTIQEEQAEFAALQEQQNIAGGGGSAEPEDAARVDAAPNPEQAADPVENVGAGVDTMDADTNGLGETPEVNA